ncbi:uncharacterized protein LOC129361193 [Poeciliopsis prolifica]|uniref:uncharacterized protein LOC129361193 n=1 Tax=Poeciliopsis prolifica TaxID=188132 RepID=UPI002412FD9E|nr:uncharacterized protein LOC129361193 [Poeciliopsis prolifica]
MEKKHMHVQHSRLSNSASLGNCRGSESRFHLSVILFFGVFSICLLIGLLVANTQYNNAKRQLTEELQDLKKTHDSKLSEIKQLKTTLDEKSAELNRALSAQNSDSKCNSNEELLSDLTKRLFACNESFFNITKERDQLIEYLKVRVGEGWSVQNNSMFNMTEENHLSGLSVNLTASFQESEKNLSLLSVEKDLLNTELDATCPDDWFTFNSSCYQASDNKTSSWDEGRADCFRKGGDLVVINDPEEAGDERF